MSKLTIATTLSIGTVGCAQTLCWTLPNAAAGPPSLAKGRPLRTFRRSPFGVTVRVSRRLFAGEPADPLVGVAVYGMRMQP
jgi:hypothetical protein